MIYASSFMLYLNISWGILHPVSRNIPQPIVSDNNETQFIFSLSSPHPTTIGQKFQIDLRKCFFDTPLHGEIMPLGIAMICVTYCHSGICQSGERRMSGHLYTVAVGYQIKASITLCQPLSPAFSRSHYKLRYDTLERCLWQTQM